jgi:hypothetical protein
MACIYGTCCHTTSKAAEHAYWARRGYHLALTKPVPAIRAPERAEAACRLPGLQWGLMSRIVPHPDAAAVLVRGVLIPIGRFRRG